MIITCRRHPALTRPAFFHHLRHKHWPMIQRLPEVLAAVPGYVQNHTVIPGDGVRPAAPFAIAAERDSVIELWFDGMAGIERLLALPSYQTQVRPDEAVFNDLPTNIMVMTEATTYFRAPAVGRCKRFDFVRRSTGVDAASFRATLDDQARRLALDPLYTAHVDRHVENMPVARNAETGFGDGSVDAVREVWGASFEALSSVAARSAVEGAGAATSFSVFATEFPMNRAAAED
jgi:hypothetical protein